MGKFTALEREESPWASTERSGRAESGRGLPQVHLRTEEECQGSGRLDEPDLDYTKQGEHPGVTLGVP